MIRTALLALLAAAALLPARADTLVETSNEARFQLDVRVPEAALAAYLPHGWKPNVATQGAAKDCNLRVIFIDRVTVNGADGKPMGKGSQRVVLLEAPVTTASGESVRLVIGGLTDDPANAPGPFGNFILANTHTMKRTTAEAASGAIVDTQDWTFAAPTGERFELHITYDRGNANKRNLSDTKYYSAKNPNFYRISRQELVLDILRNTTTKPQDRVHEFSFKATGGAYAKLFPGAVSVLSWDNVLWLNRSILIP